MSLADLAQLIASYVPTIIAAASAVSAVLPTPVPGTFWDIFAKGVNFLAMNFGHSKNMAPSVAQKQSVAIDVKNAE